MPWNNGHLSSRKFAFHHVEVSAANPTGSHADENLTVFRLRHRYFQQVQRL
jgi:hypothetical protein